MGRRLGVALCIAVANVACDAPEPEASSEPNIIVTRSEITYNGSTYIEHGQLVSSKQPFVSVIRSECLDEGFDLPRRGATNVPLNAKAWHVGRRVTEMKTESFPDLAPNAHFESGRWSFDTAAARDDKAPATRPVHATLELQSSDRRAVGRSPVTKIQVDGKVDDDTALLRIEIEDRVGVQTVWVEPNKPSCVSELELATDDSLSLSARAVDLAGNESTSAPVPATVVTRLEGFATTPRRRDDSVWAFAGMVLAILGVVAGIRRAQVTELAGEPISPLVAESVARGVLRVSVIASAVSIPVIVWWAGFDRTGALVLSTVPIWFLGKVYLARSALRHLELDGNTVERRADSLYVRSRLGRVYMGASKGMFATAERVPTSVVASRPHKIGVDDRPRDP